MKNPHSPLHIPTKTAGLKCILIMFCLSYCAPSIHIDIHVCVSCIADVSGRSLHSCCSLQAFQSPFSSHLHAEVNCQQDCALLTRTCDCH